jgi:hypothetical protein
MKYAEDPRYGDPEKAGRRLMELANAVEPVQDGRIHIERKLLVERDFMGWPPCLL